MAVQLDPSRLGREMASRGWTRGEMANAAGVCLTTISAALAGRPISPSSFRRIALALSRAEPISGVEKLLPD